MEKEMIDISDFPEISGVIGFFEQISKIPRGSGNTSLIADYLYNFGLSRGLESHRDGFDNVIIKKPATAGLEDRGTVIIQGHSDMVIAKESGVCRDLTREGVEIFREGDLIKAWGTTLGGDDGIAVAYALALLDSSDIPHPALECVFTSDEETGLIGAKNIDGSLLSGRKMINIDSDEDNVFTVGCAGGARVDITLPIKRTAPCGSFYKLTVSGLLGGHSGVDIDKGRANAIKLLTGLLFSLGEIGLCEIRGGEADNAIPRNAYAVFCSECEPDISALRNLASEMCPGEEPRISVEACDGGDILDTESECFAMSLLAALPSGVRRMSEDVSGLVETSSNLGVCKSSADSLSLTVSVRSSVNQQRDGLITEITDLAQDPGAAVSVRGEYPGWAYKKDSSLRDSMIESYERLFGSSPRVVTIHAGLECGLFSDKLEGLDCISIGPNNYDIHTPKERLSISSSAKIWRLLLDVLAE